MEDQGTYVDLNVRGVVIPRMKIMKAYRKGRCDRTRQWFEPGTIIAFKHKDQLTDQMIRALFGDGPVFHVTVIHQLPCRKTTQKRQTQDNGLPF